MTVVVIIYRLNALFQSSIYDRHLPVDSDCNFLNLRNMIIEVGKNDDVISLLHLALMEARRLNPKA